MGDPARATSPATVALANHLRQSGAKFYSAFWCPYCKQQQELFGAAAKQLPLIECDPNGTNAQPALCVQANIASFPTWEIKGQQYRGLLSLTELADLSGYSGSREFGQ
jgi:thiol-disulfide isomerase/thioredoxin